MGVPPGDFCISAKVKTRILQSYFFHAAYESCPWLLGSTLVAVKDNYTTVSHIHSTSVADSFTAAC